MRKLVAQALVLVALSSAAVPAYAHAENDGLGVNSSSLSFLDAEGRSDKVQNYWMASSEYYVATSGGLVSASAPRHVLITGWHPVEGFEAEIAAEAANRAAHTSHL